MRYVIVILLVAAASISYAQTDAAVAVARARMEWEKSKDAEFCDPEPAKQVELPANNYETIYYRNSYGLSFTWRRIKGRRKWSQFLCLGKWRTWEPGIFKRHPTMSNLCGVQLEGQMVWFQLRDANYNPVSAYQSNYNPMSYRRTTYTIPRYQFSNVACST